MDSYLSIAGTLASLIGAAISIVQAKKAFYDAERIAQYGKELIHHNQIVILSEMTSKTYDIINCIKRISHSPAKKIPRGVNHRVIATSVRDYASFLNENRDCLNDPLKNDVINLIEQLKLSSDALINMEADNDIINAAKNIYDQIDNLVPLLKSNMQTNMQYCASIN